MAQVIFPMRCIDAPNSYENCKSTFEAKCPVGFQVQGLYGIKEKGKRQKCHWVVHYSYINNEPIPRNEAKQAYDLLELGGTPEDAKKKQKWAHSRANNVECISFDYVVAKCQCGFFSFAGHASFRASDNVIVCSDRGPISISCVRFTANGHQVSIIDSSECSKLANWDYVAAILIATDTYEWINAHNGVDAEHFFTAVSIEASVIAVGGLADHEQIGEYLTNVIGSNANEIELLQLWLWVDDDTMQYMKMQLEWEMAPNREELSSLDAVSLSVNPSIKHLIDLFKQLNGSSGDRFIPDSPLSEANNTLDRNSP